MSAGLEIRPLLAGEEDAWCAGDRGRRRQERVELKSLERSGRFRPEDAWWIREEERLLGRALLLRDGAHRELARLELPWDGAWRSLARRLLAAMGEALDREGVATLVWRPLESGAPGAAALEPLALEAGFAVGEPVAALRLESLPPAGEARDEPAWESPVDGGDGVRLAGAWTGARLELALDNDGGAELQLEGGDAAADWPARWAAVFVRLRRLGAQRLDWPDAAPGAARAALEELARKGRSPLTVERRRVWTRCAGGGAAR